MKKIIQFSLEITEQTVPIKKIVKQNDLYWNFTNKYFYSNT